MDCEVVGAGVGDVGKLGALLSGCEIMSADDVLSAVREGTELHRVGTSHRGFEWFLMPERFPVPREIAELAAESGDLVTQDSAVGVICWVYRAAQVERESGTQKTVV